MQINQLKTQLGPDNDFDLLTKQKQIVTKDIKDCENALDTLRTKFAKLKEEQSKKKEEVQALERALLEKDFELKEIENEKAIRKQDQQVNQTLEELKKRCKGYLGQLYELIKPIQPQYDIAVKVALSKCLKFLIVENEEAAEYCTDFLKEKQLYKDVLVLSNVPDRHIDGTINKRLKDQGTLVIDVIDVTRRHANLDKAVRYFLGEKVVCQSFDVAAKLQKMGFKDIVTEDGTEFKSGMISGGIHQNIFNISLGSNKLDTEITKLAKEI